MIHKKTELVIITLISLCLIFPIPSNNVSLPNHSYLPAFEWDNAPWDKTVIQEQPFWWDLRVYDQYKMYMRGVSNPLNLLGSKSFIYFGFEVQVDTAKKVKIGAYGLLNAFIISGTPGSVWIKISAVLCDETMNPIDQHQLFKRSRANGANWTGRNVVINDDFDVYKLDYETTLQPGHKYYVCVRLEGWLCYWSQIYGINNNFAQFHVSCIMWEFY